MKTIAIIEDRKSPGVNGGTFNAGFPQTRDLNTLVYNRNNLVSLNTFNSRFTLPEGEFEIEWRAPAHSVWGNQSELYNATSNTVVQYGSTDTAYDNGSSEGIARVQITSNTEFEIRHTANHSRIGDGFGYGANTGTYEVYTQVKVSYM